MQTVTLQRVASLHALGQVGKLIFPAGRELFALERQTSNKIVDTSNAKSYPCIPAGFYDVEITDSPRFRIPLYLVKNVPGRFGIRFHGANYPEELQGCIAPGLSGMYTSKICVVNDSQAALKVMYKELNFKPFKLRIKDAV